ncbi:hypothetical protein CAPN003_01950 [Capnocytophaga stomatis]|nr:hypothetical protein CAPN003_01950 [Capnocytophaga stomatis]
MFQKQSNDQLYFFVTSSFLRIFANIIQLLANVKTKFTTQTFTKTIASANSINEIGAVAYVGFRAAY